MRHWYSVSVLGVMLAAGTATVPSAVHAQTAASKATGTAGKTYRPPRVADGRPDLQGVWDFRSLTPLERPGDAAGKEVFSDEEAAIFEQQAAARRNQDRRDGAGTDADVGRAYNDFWWDFGKKITTNRTSLIVDPPDGRIPALSTDAQQRAAAAVKARTKPTEGPEDRSLQERCIMGFNSGPPMVPSAYNNNTQLFQTRDYVVILNEMVHDARIIPMDGRPHGTIRQWAGDSRGRWEGDTLVVDTTNFLRETSFRNSTANLHLIERFTRVNDDTLLYEFTVTDPTTWASPWTAAISMKKNPEHMYEYACHEGNYGMFGILSGARAQESAAAAGNEKSE